MIQVQNLTKFYGDYAAVRDVTFSIPRGQIVGFLGPNGAGKTTTMRILAGFLSATSGTASIDGLDVFWNSVAVRRRIGYMPESCPLYGDMRVREYLSFRAGIKGLGGSQKRSRIDYVLKQCWLVDVQRQLIGTLSKGYRQRVGLADTLLADPAVLILDEPTAGLDPAQIRETRNLIRELGREHTLILSTHILPEVEMTCNRVIIIHQGRMAASGMLDDLEGEAGTQPVLELKVHGRIDEAPIRESSRVVHVDSELVSGVTHLRIFTTALEEFLPDLSTIIAARGWTVRELKPRKQTLEELFVRITSN
jgi:ABC-2 type transport system ATP-binding protein